MANRPANQRPATAVTGQLRVALLTLVGVLVVTATLVLALTAKRTRDAARNAGLNDLATLAAAQVRHCGSSAGRSDHDDIVAALQETDEAVTNDTRRFGRALLATDQAVALAITDPDGAVAFHWPAADRTQTHLAIPHAGARDRMTGNSAPAGGEMLIACAPIAKNQTSSIAGYACVFGAATTGATALTSTLAAPVAATCAVAVFTVLLALRYLKRNLCEPLARLSAAGAGRPAALPVERNDELGAIARGLDDLHSDLESARDDARRVERTIDATVTRETRQISNQLRRAQRSAEIDALTGLANRRFVEERLEAVFSEQLGRSVNLAIVMLDVDNFKPLNDTAGHAAGDALLRFIGELLSGTLREHDVGVRYGGDEFALILVDVSGAQARKIAERILRMFAKQTAVTNLPTAVTLSAGIASLDEVNARSGAELMARADDALYTSKNQGKNLALSATD